MSKTKSLADSGFITEMKDKNGDSWYHQIVLEAKEEEIERLNNIINEFEVWLNDKYEEMHDIWYIKVLNKLKELKGSE